MSEPDPGLPQERTSLAWQRSGVTGALLGAGAMVAASHRQGRGLVLVVTVVAVVGAVLSAVVAGRPVAVGRPRPSPWTRLVLTAAVPSMIALVGLVLALT